MAANSIRAQLTIASQKIRLFASIIAWILTDVLHNAKRLSIIIISFSIASVFTRLWILGLLMIFVKAQTENQPIIVGGYEIPSDTSLATLTIWGGCVLLLAIVTGLISYLAESLSFKMAREAMLRASDRALTVIAAGQTQSMPLWSGGGMKMISRKAIISDSMMLMRSMLVLGGVAVPLITLCVFGAVLFYINTKLTLFLLPAILIYAVPFYMLNRGVAAASRDYELRRVVRSRAVTRILDFASQTQYPGILRPVWADHLKADPSAPEVIASFREIILSKRKLAMLQDILFGLVLCVVLVVFGSFRAAGTIDWLPLLWYLVALRFVMTGINGTASLTIAFNRFTPQLRRLKEFTTIDIPAASTNTAKDISAMPLCIQAIEPKLTGSMSSALLQVGEIIACIGEVSIDSYHVRNFCEKLIGNSMHSRSLADDIVYCGDVCNIPQMRISELVTGQSKPDSESIKPVETVLNRMGVLDEIHNLPKGMNTVLTESVIEDLSPSCCYGICFSYALSCSRKYVVLDWKPLARLQEIERKRILDSLSDRVVILVSINEQAAQLANASLIVVMDETSVKGIGSPAWFQQISHDNFPCDKDYVLAGVADDFDDL